MKTKDYGILVVFFLITCIYFFEKDRIHHLEVPVPKKGTSLNTSKSDSVAKVAEYVHPEQMDDEIFLTNVDTCKYTRIERAGEITWASSFYKRGNRPVPSGYINDYSSIGHETKRLGKVAYDVNGDTISYLRPVFVKK